MLGGAGIGRLYLLVHPAPPMLRTGQIQTGTVRGQAVRRDAADAISEGGGAST